MALDHPGNDPLCHFGCFIDPGNDKSDPVPFSRQSCHVTLVGNGVNAKIQTDKVSPFINIGNDTGVFPLPMAFLQVIFIGVLRRAFCIRHNRYILHIRCLYFIDAD